MADFVSKGIVKSAERILATPIADMSTFQTLVNGVITDNPWGCTSYVEAGVTVAGVRKGSEYYSGKVVYQNIEAKVIGQVSVKAPTSSGFNTSISNVLANTALETAIGGTAAHDASGDNFSITLRCHDANGEQYTVSFKRDKIIVSSYTADSILSTIETWADGVAALA